MLSKNAYILQSLLLSSLELLAVFQPFLSQ
jgi:hypothetical protein